MRSTESQTFRVRVRGEWACFTRPELKVERVSYEVMTPSAARGVFEALLWKPSIEWTVHRIEVLAPIRWFSVRRNEVNSRASLEKRCIVADEDRAQRNMVALRDVDYVVDASFRLTALAGADETVRKFEEMFARRLHKGQWHTPPYLGCREFAATVSPADGCPSPHERGIDRPLGLMFYDFDWTGSDGGPHRESRARVPLFFDARLTDGVLAIPPREAVRRSARGSA
jgi:CRISPR-associated protein Cas5d